MNRSYPWTHGRLGHRETTILLILVISSRIFLGLPRLMAEIGGTAGWLAVTVAFIGALLGYFVLDTLLVRFPGQDLIGIARATFGVFGPFFGLLLFFFFLASTSLVTRVFAETFIVGILPRTPIGVITGLLLVLLILASYMGIETISRLAILYAPYLVLFLFLIFLLVLPNANFLHLTPVLGTGAKMILLPGLAKSAVFADIVLLGLYAPVLRQQDKRRAVALAALIGSYLLFLLTTLVFTAVFDYPSTTKIFFPVYQLTRLISLAEFFQRTEAVFIFLWFFVAVISLSATFYSASYILCRAFSLPSHRPLLFPLAVVVYALSLLPASFAEAVAVDTGILRYYGWLPAFLVPSLLLIVAILRGRKGAESR